MGLLDSLKGMFGKGTATVDDATERATGMAEDAADTAQEMAADASEQADDMADDASEKAKGLMGGEGGATDAGGAGE